MKKVLFALMLMAIFACTAFGVQHQVAFVDEFGEPVTTITSITVFDSGLSSSPTIYADRASTVTVTNPITTSSTNSTFDQSLGLVRWFQTKPNYKLTVTDGSKTLTIDAQDEGDTRFPWYDNYIGTAASLSVTDNQSITVGTDSDMVLAWNNGSSFMSWIPASDGSAYNLGTSGTSKNVDFNWFVGTALGIKANEGTATLVIDGVTTSINASSNFATNINTGSSTGAITIGSSTSGTLAFDSTSGITMNADDSIAVTASAGTIGLGATGGDITIDGVDSSVIIRGTEEAADAILLDADGTAGGIELQCGTGDITLDSGDDIFLEANTGTGDVISIINTAGTHASAVILRTVAAGSIDIDSGDNITVNVADDYTLDTAEGAVSIIADGTTAGDITLDSEDDLILTSTGKVTITNTEPVTISGTLTPVAVNIVDFVVTDQASVTLTAAMSGKILVIADLAQNTTIDLPAEADGMNFEFWYVGGAAEVHDHIIDAEANANFYIGGLQFIDSDDNTITEVYSNGSSNAKLTLSNMECGTVVKITCDGINWYIWGVVYSDTAPAFADAV